MSVVFSSYGYYKLTVMRKYLTILVVLTVVYSAVSANEIDKPKTPVGMAVVKTGAIVKLYYRGLKPSDVRITIFNEKGEPVYKETIRHIESFVRPYNFSTLGEGDYTIELNGEEGKQLQKVSYHKERSKKLMNIIRVAGTEDKYMLRVSNRGTDKLQIKIYNRSNALIYDADESIDGDFAKIYDLGKTGSGFLFEITDKNGLTQTVTYNR